MTGRRKRRVLGALAAASAVVAVTAVALVVVGNGGGRDSDQQAETALSTAVVEQRDLAEYLEIDGTLDYEGTVTLTARNTGVLMHFAEEGTVVGQGDRLYRVVHEPSDGETARILAEVAAARDALSAATDRLENLRKRLSN